MPETATGSTGAGFLTRKIGPLPVWMWSALIVGAYYVWTKYEKKNSTATAAAPSVASAGTGASIDPATGQTYASELANLQDQANALATDNTTGASQSDTTNNYGGNGRWRSPPDGATATTAAPTTTAVSVYKAPTGLTSKVSGTGVTLSWSLAGQPSPPPASYTVAVYSSTGALATESTVSVPDATADTSGTTLANLPKGKLTANVWANGGKTAPPHASTSFTIG